MVTVMEEKYKMGIFGSASERQEPEQVKKAAQLGEALARRGCRVVTGACGGLPYAAAEAAAKLKGVVWGFSPAADRGEHVRWYPGQDMGIYTKMTYVPKEIATRGGAVCRKYRNVISTAHCDAGIIIASRWGTMHEFCSLYDYGKVIGVLTQTGGVADELLGLCKKINKDTGAKVFFNRAPEQLVETVRQELELRRKV